MDNFPSAILLARLQDVVMNNNVLYRLVRPTEAGTSVLSVDRLVNVVPHRRIYRFDRKDELNEFCNELLRRPLVLQPVVHFGRGLGKGSLACGMCYRDDKWVMMVNQTHPKVLSRLQIGLDAARKAMASGQSFEVKFAFTKLVEKLYRKNLSKTEQEKAASSLDLFKTYFRYAEWEHGDLILRYHGYGALLGRGGGMFDKNLPTLNLTFEFEDLWQQEIGWKTLGAEYFPHPHLSPVTEDEIRDCLPAWTVNGVSPLENIGDHVPAANYSYAQAGRLYESFRKKKRKPRATSDDMAAGGAPAPRPTVSDGIELKVMGDEGQMWRPPRYEDEEEDDHGFRSHGGRDVGARHPTPTAPPMNAAGASFYDGGVPGSGHAGQMRDAYPEDDGFYEEKGAKQKTYRQNGQLDSHGHLYPDIQVNAGKSRDRQPSQEREPSPSYHSTRQNHYADVHHQSQFTRLRMQGGSDRSSHSETGSGVTDSGIDSDGHVREGSFDRPPYTKPVSGSPPHPYAMDNMAFHHEEDSDVNEAMRRHKELVAKMMGGSGGQSPGYVSGSGQHGYHNNRQPRHTSQSSDRDDYHSSGKAGYPMPSPRSGLPSPSGVSGKQYNYASPATHYGGGRSPSWQNTQSSQQQVEESFI